MSETKHLTGGYMRSLHTVEEKLYSPELKLSGSTAFKVLLFIRHQTIRWDAYNAPFTYSQIAKVVGTSERNVKKIIKELESAKLICVTRTTQNNRDLSNLIGLNLETFGEVIEQHHKPKLSVINGGKEQKLSTGVSYASPRGVSYASPQGCPIDHPEHPQNSLPSSLPGSLNNCIKKTEKKLLKSGIEESFTQENRDQEPLIEDWPVDDAERARAIREMIQFGSAKGALSKF